VSPTIRVVDLVDRDGFGRIPPCADPGFDHRTCDYWEDEHRGSKAARLSWLEGAAPAPAPRPGLADNPFAPVERGPARNPFDPRAAAGGRPSPFDPFADADDEPLDNPFAPRRERGPAVEPDAPRKLQLLGRGLAVFGSYAKVLEVDGEPAAYCQFGPLSAYPRAQRLRELYSQLPDSPLPAVITCISSTVEARRRGFARQLVEDVCADLAGRGFAAVEAYPDLTRDEDETSAGRPVFWHALGFVTAVDDERFPVMRLEL
jgi:ribosomal protein S18 acetylase RimI-like enzyme